MNISAMSRVAAAVVLAVLIPACGGGSSGSVLILGTVTTPIGAFDARAFAVVVQADGKIVLAGFANNGTDSDIAVVRYNSNGSLDTTFDTDGIVTTPASAGSDIAYAVAVQADGKIVVTGLSGVGTDLDIVVVRYNVDGSLDTTFDGDGIATTPVSGDNDVAFALAIQTDGKIVVTGYTGPFANFDVAVVRYNTDGSLDTTFDADGIVVTPVGAGHEVGRAVLLQADGKIVVAGRAHNGADDDFLIMRYNADGSLDATFDGNGIASTPVGAGNDEGRAAVLQPDGRIVVLGISFDGASQEFALVRYNTNGSLDTGFDVDGIVTTSIGPSNDYGYAVALQPDGRIVGAGPTSNGGDDDFAVVRYDTDGSLDLTFDGDGIATTAVGAANDVAFAVTLQANGGILAAGYSEGGTTDEFALVRY